MHLKYRSDMSIVESNVKFEEFNLARWLCYHLASILKKTFHENEYLLSGTAWSGGEAPTRICKVFGHFFHNYNYDFHFTITVIFAKRWFGRSSLTVTLYTLYNIQSYSESCSWRWRWQRMRKCHWKSIKPLNPEVQPSAFNLMFLT